VAGQLTAGRAFVDLVPRLKDGFANDVERQVEGEQGRIGGAMGKVGAVAGRALIAGAGAAVAVGIKSVIDFAGFERQMNEVFTLLPGISGPAMDKMTDQVKGFATEFGVLPDKLVPALYQSLSAGVPPGNVFEFLETSQKAAKGGVTDLTTAVDGISSVVNAYGAELVDATKASDLMFTTVRLGKTNFQELSASLFNVTPTAAGLGVAFEDVTAALAAMTLQGVPTSVATTQLRQLFVELSKEGSATAGVFEDIAGKSFKEFIAAGGNTAQALELLKKHADETGVGVNDLFGSVEAGSAALTLAGSETFTDNLVAMGDAAGATDKAFQTMNKGIGPVFDKIKARLAVLAIEIGERIAPVLERAFVAAEDIFSDVARVIGTVVDAFKILSGDDGAQGFGEVMDNLLGNSGKYVDLFRRIGEVIITVGTFIRDNLKPILIGLGVTLALLISPIGSLVAALIYAYTQSETFRDIVDAVIAFIVNEVAPRVGKFVDYIVEQFGNLVEWVRTHWDQISEAIDHVITVVSGIIEFAIAAISLAWEYFGDTILATAQAAWDAIRAHIEFAIDLIRGVIEFVLAIINGDWGKAWDAIKDILASAWEFITTLVSGALDVVTTLIGDGLGAAKDLVFAILEEIVGFFRDLPGMLIDAAGDLWGWVVDGLSGILNAVVNLFEDAVNLVIDAMNVAIRAYDALPFVSADTIDDVDFEVGRVTAPPTAAELARNRSAPGGRISPEGRGLAEGGKVIESGLSWVGEQEPELLDLRAGARVIPLNALGDLVAEGAGHRGPVVAIDEAHFDDEVDIDLLFSRAAFASMAGRFDS